MIINYTIKELFNDKNFNSVALKIWYQLLNLNQQNEKLDFKSGSHWDKYNALSFFLIKILNIINKF